MKKNIKHNDYTSNNINGFDFTNKSFIDFNKKHSLLELPSSSNIKSSSTIGDLYDTEILGDKITKQCINKVQQKSTHKIKYNKTISTTLCKCLFDKNRHLKYTDLEYKIKTKQHTPSSQCILLLDKYEKQNKKPDVSTTTIKTRKSKTSKTSRNSKKSKKSRNT